MVVPLVGQPQPQQQQQFPATHFQINPDGMLIMIVLAPGFSTNIGVNEETMNAICQKWLETRQAVQQQLQMLKHLKETKNS